MSTELQILACTMGLGLIHIVLAAALSVQQRGLAWAMGPRDNTPPLTGVAGRVYRALCNFSETFPIFAAAILAVVVAQRGNANTVLGAQIYLWARLIYIPAYAISIPYLRTLIWAASLLGMLMVLKVLF